MSATLPCCGRVESYAVEVRPVPGVDGQWSARCFACKADLRLFRNGDLEVVTALPAGGPRAVGAADGSLIPATMPVPSAVCTNLNGGKVR